MDTRVIRACAGTLLFGSVLLTPLFLGAGEKRTPPADEPGQAANFVRVLNAAEVNFFRSNNRYATFPELVKSGNVGDVPTASLNLQADFEPMPGFRLRLLLAPD